MCKQISAMSAFVLAVSSHGLQSEAFRCAYDLQMSTLALEPVAHLELPDFLKWARHQMDISATDEVSTWIGRTYSASLAKNGVVDVAREQEALWSERLASLLRITDRSDRTKHMVELFSLELDLDLEPPLKTFVEALAVCLAREDFDQLEERVELLSDAIYEIEKSTPCSTAGRAGTMIGGTLATFPAGTALVTESRLALARATCTINSLKPFTVALDQFSGALSQCPDSLLLCGRATLTSLMALAVKTAAIFTDGLADVMPDYRPSSSTPSIKSLMDTWQQKYRRTAYEVLRPVLTSSTSIADLHKWAGAQHNSAAVVRMLSDTTASLKPMIKDSAEVAHLSHLSAIHDWLHKCSDFLSPTGNRDKRTVESLQALYRQCMSVPEASDVEAKSFIVNFEDFRNGSVLAKGGEYARAVRQATLRDGKEVVELVLQTLREVLGSALPFASLDLSVLDDHSLELAVNTDIDEDTASNARKWAKTWSDDLLVLQIEACCNSVALRRALARAEKCTRQYFQPDIPLKDRRICESQTNSLQEARVQFAAFIRFSDAALHVFDADIVNKDVAHLDTLHGSLDLRALRPSFEREFARIQATFAEAWSSDMRKVMKAIRSFCPAWEACEQDMLSSPDCVQQMLNMRQSHFEALGPLASELKSSLALLQKMGGSSPVDAQLRKEALNAVTFAVKTVVYRIVICCTQRDWLELSSPAETAKAVQELRAKLAPKNVALTEQMEKVLADWASGEKLNELEAARAARKAKAPSRPAGVPNQDSALQHQPSTGTGDSRSLVAPSGDVVELQTRAKGPPLGVSSLVQRAAAAKRRKL